MKKLLLLLLVAPALLPARSVRPLYLGTWTTGGKEPIVLTLGYQDKYTWNKTEGLYQVMGGQIWLMEKNRTGTKWMLKTELDTLTLTYPEDFRYGGGKRYIYFQMTNPAVAHVFTRVRPKD